jgi:4-amino-4-deoxy-L-arabinose transferase-like glycosyltransferase
MPVCSHPCVPGSSRSTPHPLLTGLVVLAGLFLRLPGMFESLWFDEVFRTRVMLSGKTVRELLLYDVHNPLYNGFMFLWVRVFGDSEVSIRTPSLLAGFALIAMLYRWAKVRFSPWVAWFAAAWLLLSPVPVWYSTEAKNTIFTALFAVLTLVTHDRLLREPESPRVVARAAATAVLALLCDFQLLLAILPCWLVLLLETRRTPGLGRALAVTVGVSGAITMPWVLFKALHISRLHRNYLGLFHLKHLLWLLCMWLPLGSVAGAPGPNMWPLYVALPALIVLPLLALGVREAGSTPQGRLVRAGLLLPIAFYLAASFLLHAAGDSTRIYQDRNLTVIVPLFPLVLGLGIESLSRAGVRRVLAAALLGSAAIASGLIATVKADAWTVMAPNPDWRGAARALGPEPMISTCPLLPLRYYAPEATLVELPEGADPLESLEQHLSTNPTPAFTFIHNPNWNPLPERARAEMDARYPLMERREFRSLTVEKRRTGKPAPTLPP